MQIVYSKFISFHDSEKLKKYAERIINDNFNTLYHIEEMKKKKDNE